jgi:hypothetical protein
MRTEQDIVRLQLGLAAELELDLERVGADPVFRALAGKHGILMDDVVDYEVLRPVLQEYVQHYLVRERFLAKMPSTNGPGALRPTSMEVRFYGEHASNAEPGGNNGASGVATEGS